jgi:hypothetical protein
MKTIKIIMMVLSLSVMYQFSDAQNCQSNKVKMSKGYKGQCGCHCTNQCVLQSEVQTYINNGWYVGECNNVGKLCCSNWIRTGKDGSIETSLGDISPSPASGNVNITFTLASNGEVSFDLFDMTGRYVSTIAHDVFQEDGNQVTWDASQVNPGIYFIKMKAGSYSAIKRISIIK